MTTRTAVILAGGSSRRIGRDKGLIQLKDKPMVTWVAEKLAPHVDQTICIVGTAKQQTLYRDALDGVEVHMDAYPEGSPLIGLITGLMKARGDFAVVVACDMPFISGEAVELLFSHAEGRDAATIVKPNGWIEPLFSVYNVSTSLAEATRLYRAGELRIRMVIRNLSNVAFLDTETLRKVDPELRSLMDMDTHEKLRVAESLT